MSQKMKLDSDLLLKQEAEKWLHRTKAAMSHLNDVKPVEYHSSKPPINHTLGTSDHQPPSQHPPVLSLMHHGKKPLTGLRKRPSSATYGGHPGQRRDVAPPQHQRPQSADTSSSMSSRFHVLGVGFRERERDEMNISTQVMRFDETTPRSESGLSDGIPNAPPCSPKCENYDTEDGNNTDSGAPDRSLTPDTTDSPLDTPSPLVAIPRQHLHLQLPVVCDEVDDDDEDYESDDCDTDRLIEMVRSNSRTRLLQRNRDSVSKTSTAPENEHLDEQTEHFENFPPNSNNPAVLKSTSTNSFMEGNENGTNLEGDLIKEYKMRLERAFSDGRNHEMGNLSAELESWNLSHDVGYGRYPNSNGEVTCVENCYPNSANVGNYREGGGGINCDNYTQNGDVIKCGDYVQNGDVRNHTYAKNDVVGDDYTENDDVMNDCIENYQSKPKYHMMNLCTSCVSDNKHRIKDKADSNTNDDCRFERQSYYQNDDFNEEPTNMNGHHANCAIYHESPQTFHKPPINPKTSLSSERLTLSKTGVHFQEERNKIFNITPRNKGRKIVKNTSKSKDTDARMMSDADYQMAMDICRMPMGNKDSGKHSTEKSKHVVNKTRHARLQHLASVVKRSSSGCLGEVGSRSKPSTGEFMTRMHGCHRMSKMKEFIQSELADTANHQQTNEKYLGGTTFCGKNLDDDEEYIDDDEDGEVDWDIHDANVMINSHKENCAACASVSDESNICDSRYDPLSPPDDSNHVILSPNGKLLRPLDSSGDVKYDTTPMTRQETKMCSKPEKNYYNIVRQSQSAVKQNRWVANRYEREVRPKSPSNEPDILDCLHTQQLLTDTIRRTPAHRRPWSAPVRSVQGHGEPKNTPPRTPKPPMSIKSILVQPTNTMPMKGDNSTKSNPPQMKRSVSFTDTVSEDEICESTVTEELPVTEQSNVTEEGIKCENITAINDITASTPNNDSNISLKNHPTEKIISTPKKWSAKDSATSSKRIIRTYDANQKTVGIVDQTKSHTQAKNTKNLNPSSMAKNSTSAKNTTMSQNMYNKQKSIPKHSPAPFSNHYLSKTSPSNNVAHSSIKDRNTTTPSSTDMIGGKLAETGHSTNEMEEINLDDYGVMTCVEELPTDQSPEYHTYNPYTRQRPNSRSSNKNTKPPPSQSPKPHRATTSKSSPKEQLKSYSTSFLQMAKIYAPCTLNGHGPSHKRSHTHSSHRTNSKVPQDRIDDSCHLTTKHYIPPVDTTIPGMDECLKIHSELADKGITMDIHTLTKALLPPDGTTRHFNLSNHLPKNTHMGLLSNPRTWFPDEQRNVEKYNALLRKFDEQKAREARSRKLVRRPQSSKKMEVRKRPSSASV